MNVTELLKTERAIEPGTIARFAAAVRVLSISHVSQANLQFTVQILSRLT